MESTIGRSRGDWIQTYTGKRFYPINPSADEVDIEDIAWSLSHTVRFCGHVKKPFTVAQHSVIVSNICDKEDAMWGLLHDASEAYVSDVSTPVKSSPEFAFYREIESRIMEKVCDKFRLPRLQPASIKRADVEAFVSEALTFMSPLDGEFLRHINDIIEANNIKPKKIRCVSSKNAFKMFMNRFEEINKGLVV